MLQAKMDDFWTQRIGQAKAHPDLLGILAARRAQAAQTTELVVQRMPIAKLTEEEKSRMKSWVREGAYQEVLNLLISKFPKAQIKQGNATVRNVSDFSTVVDKSEIPPHGGFGVTLGGKINKKSTIPEVYISDDHIKKWVEGDQFGSLVNTIQHELTHAHQSDDDQFISESGASPTRIHVMEFEAFSGEIRNAYRALKEIDFDESKAGKVEWPTQADLILAHESMQKHYSKMSEPEQEKYHKIKTAVDGYYPVVIDFLDRYYNPASLYKSFEATYNEFAQSRPGTFKKFTDLLREEALAYQNAAKEYALLDSQFNSLSSKGLDEEQLKKWREERKAIIEKMKTATSMKESAYTKMKGVYSDFFDTWEKEDLKVYQIFSAMNTHEQEQFKKYVKIFSILPGRKPDFREGATPENVKKVISSYQEAVNKWNENVQEIINLSAEINWLEKPEPVKADLHNPATPPVVEAVREQDPFHPSPTPSKEEYIKQLNELASESEYVKYHLKNIAPEGFDGFSPSLLRKNLVAARQGKLTWQHINDLKKGEPSVAVKLESMDKLWFKDMSPHQLYTFYEQLKTEAKSEAQTF